MLRQAEAEAVTATAVATATVSRMRLRLREQQNPTTGFSSESYGECFHICFYTSLLGCFAGIIQEGGGGTMKRRRVSFGLTSIDSSVSFGPTPIDSSVSFRRTTIDSLSLIHI